MIENFWLEILTDKVFLNSLITINSYMFDNISPINNNYISDNTIDVLINKEGVLKYNISEIYNKFNGLDKTYDKKNIICFNSFMNNKYSNILSNYVVLDAGLSNKNNAPIFSNNFGFRLPANMLSYNIMTLHNLIMYFIAGIVYFTLFAIGDIIYKFSYSHFRGIKSYNNSKKIYDINIVHSSLMEWIWVVLPIIILISIAMPSFCLMYSAENQQEGCSVIVEVTGNQWYWSYDVKAGIKVDFLHPPISFAYERLFSIRDPNYKYNISNITHFDKISAAFPAGIDQGILTATPQRYYATIEHLDLIKRIMDLKLASKEYGYITFNRYQLLDDIISHYARVKEKELHLADEFTLYDRGKYAFLWNKCWAPTSIREVCMNAKCVHLYYDKINTNFPKDISLKFDSYILPNSDYSMLEEEKHARLLKTDNPLILPVGTNVKFILRSSDVIHNWAIPELGVKLDATPGRITTFTTIINREGTFYGQCSELCGANHGFMPIEVKAINPYAFMEYYLTNAENVYWFKLAALLDSLWDLECIIGPTRYLRNEDIARVIDKYSADALMENRLVDSDKSKKVLLRYHNKDIPLEKNCMGIWMEKTSLVTKMKEFLTYNKVTGRFKVFEEFHKIVGIDNKEVIDGETWCDRRARRMVNRVRNQVEYIKFKDLESMSTCARKRLKKSHE